MKTALITGVSGGMGAATAAKLISEGYRVVGLDVKEPESDDFAFIKTDLTDPSSVEAARLAVDDAGIKLDCIVNMAGIYDLNSLVEMDEEEFVRIFNVNLFAAYRVNKAFLPYLAEDGRIIVTSSELAPLDPLPFTGVYGITKTAVEKYAFSLRMELQLLGKKVVVLRPGAVDTGLLDVSTKRLEDFTASTKLYSYNAKRFKNVVDRVEAKKIPAEKIAVKVSRILKKRRPGYVYSIN